MTFYLRHRSRSVPNSFLNSDCCFEPEGIFNFWNSCPVHLKINREFVQKAPKAFFKTPKTFSRLSD